MNEYEHLKPSLSLPQFPKKPINMVNLHISNKPSQRCQDLETLSFQQPTPPLPPSISTQIIDPLPKS